MASVTMLSISMKDGADGTCNLSRPLNIMVKITVSIMNLQIQKMYQNKSLSVMSNMSTIQQLFSLLVICFFVCFTYPYNVQRTLNYDKNGYYTYITV